MITEKIKHILIKSLSLNKVQVTGNNNHINIIAIDDIFNNKSEVEKQQMIYTQLMDYITNKTIHAISIKTYSLKEWKNNQKKIN
ncbi:BolA/IbaG family iron-sulfur metabolism protein [Buchnera aphidicola]|uniref:BolA/IbaG family iron-sulfur metabolism protein n=1 Tax=Buchnera aphidicola subsp. Melaphis rhois TaxID=118103 RepID=A0A4D6YG98_BUCMH|nr:BolA/IbaG family iron-sulfur metabolism protein [Buchnera aphidicola]QCI23365.1 BolA/IbaG family iron-sulfur metabolism protein [Buchnera aphidicola (Melaphis rhois)]